MVVDRDGDGDDGSNFCPRTPIPGDMLSFQKLDVYKCSVEFVAVAIEVCVWMPKGHAALSDQLRRAAFSVPLNIAEAAGRTSQADAAPLRDSERLCHGICSDLRCRQVSVRAATGTRPAGTGAARSHRRDADQALSVKLIVAVAVAVNVHVNVHDGARSGSAS